jgi:putative glutamine amidotransferase
MRKPVIGLTTGRRNRPTEGNEVQNADMGCDIMYPAAVIRAGGAPVLLPRSDDEDVMRSVMERVDGLLLTGGGDVVSLAYGEEPHPRSAGQDPVRDAADFAAIRVALERGLPILGICRGIQSLNVALGGTLVQDVPSQVAGACQHYTRAGENVLGHTVDVEPGSLLVRVLGVTQTAANSWHHQAVKDVADGLRINCRARDGVIEGVEAADGRPILAVQCHPEDAAEQFPLFRRLFDWLVAEAARLPRSDG